MNVKAWVQLAKLFNTITCHRQRAWPKAVIVKYGTVGYHPLLLPIKTRGCIAELFTDVSWVLHQRLFWQWQTIYYKILAGPTDFKMWY